MASSTDFQKLYDLYESDGVPKGLSIVQFCQMNGIVYKHFERWYKTTRVAQVIPVEVVAVPGQSAASVSPVEPSCVVPAPSALSVLSFDIHFSNGLSVHHDHLDYPSFRSLVEKLEVLC